MKRVSRSLQAKRAVETHGVVDETGAGGGSSEAEEGGELAEPSLGLTLLSSLTSLAALAEKSGSDGDGEGGEEDEGRELLELGILGLVARDGSAGSVERVELAVSRSVEEVVLADAEDLDHLLVEAGHHAGLGSALAHADETVDVLGGAEGLLPELELDSSVELLEASVEVSLEGVGVVEVDRVRLVRVLLGRSEVGAEGLREATKLGLALVGEAEGESLVRNGLFGEVAVSSAREACIEYYIPGRGPQDERCCGGCRGRCGRPPRGNEAKG